MLTQALPYVWREPGNKATLSSCVIPIVLASPMNCLCPAYSSSDWTWVVVWISTTLLWVWHSKWFSQMRLHFDHLSYPGSEYLYDAVREVLHACLHVHGCDLHSRRFSTEYFLYSEFCLRWSIAWFHFAYESDVYTHYMLVICLHMQNGISQCKWYSLHLLLAQNFRMKLSIYLNTSIPFS